MYVYVGGVRSWRIGDQSSDISDVGGRSMSWNYLLCFRILLIDVKPFVSVHGLSIKFSSIYHTKVERCAPQPYPE
jgi:hypothetical protein